MSASRRDRLKELQASLKATLRHFDRPVAVQKRSYAPGKWTMRELLVHVSDTEAVLLDRLRRLAADRKPVLQGFDQDEWARGLEAVSIPAAKADAPCGPSRTRKGNEPYPEGIW